jgi:hypothetical protein
MHPAMQRRAWLKKQPKRPQFQATPFDLGWQRASLQWAAARGGGDARPPAGPFGEGSPAWADYQRGWRAAWAKFSREQNRQSPLTASLPVKAAWSLCRDEQCRSFRRCMASPLPCSAGAPVPPGV